MSKHLSKGEEIPVFFYGQSYGFSFIEISMISATYFFLGISDISVKLSMLILWTIGIVFFYLTLKHIGFINNAWLPLIITLVFVFLPSYAVWSMKARGGYLTAFALFTVYTYLIFNKKINKVPISLFICGLLIVLIYYSQALWIVGLIPLIIYQVISIRGLRLNLAFFAGGFAGIIAFNFLISNIYNYWSPTSINLSDFSLENVLLIPQLIFNHVTGYYSYAYLLKPDLITLILASIITALIFFLLIISLYFILRKIRINKWFYFFTLSIFLTISVNLFLNIKNPRYFLPLTAYSLFALFYLLNHLANKVIINSALVFMLALGAISMYNFKDFRYEDKNDIVELINELKSENIHYVYSEGGLLQWQIIFYSNEAIIARYKNSTDRYPKYIKQMEDALKAGDNRFALVGFVDTHKPSLSGNVNKVNKKYYFLVNPDKSVLIERGFNIR
jgi:hypothetical protein